MSRQGEYRKPTLENIKAFWETEAKEIGNNPQVTIRDLYFRIHELHTLLPLIPFSARLLDVGCGTGFGTIVLTRRAEYTLGIDYSDKMIFQANKFKNDSLYLEQIVREFIPLWNITLNQNSNVEFMQGDVLNLELSRPPFDIITGQRILINLPTHDTQMEALKTLRKNIKENGLLILVEATTQGHSRTDTYRERYGLSKLEKYWHNRYVDELKFQEWEKSGWKVQYNLGFETYMLLSKVIYPAACGEENCSFLSGANAAAMELACLFRSKNSVDEVGQESFFKMYVERVDYYDSDAARKIESWISTNVSKLSDWSQLGHQRLIIAKAC